VSSQYISGIDPEPERHVALNDSAAESRVIVGGRSPESARANRYEHCFSIIKIIIVIII